MSAMRITAARLWFWGSQFAIPAVVFLYVIVAPFTKVEESFNLQAVHDMVFHKLDFDAYDHKEFPGVVPRSFVGAFLITAASRNIGTFFVESYNQGWKFLMQYIVRVFLGLYTAASLIKVQRAVGKKFGMLCGTCFGILTITQFHMPFYASRFLPNTFALMLSNFALAGLIEGNQSTNIVWQLTFGCAVFRCDLVLLLLPVSLLLLLQGSITFRSLVWHGVLSSLFAVAVTVCFDSWLWGRWVWPELEVFLFNNPVDNRSAAWGVASAHWYFTAALPKALTGSLLFLVHGVIQERRVRPIAAVALAFVLLYSMLPHKELRFLFPVLTYFNVAAAAGLDRILKTWNRRGFGKLACVASVGVLLLSLAYTAVSVAASRLNYPGGEAFQALHVLEADRKYERMSVHIDVFPAMTGVSRFGELYEMWTYSKEEEEEERESSIGQGDQGASSQAARREMAALYKDKGYTYLVSGDREPPEGYKLILEVEGFAGVEFPRSLGALRDAFEATEFPIRFRTSPQVWIHAAR